MYMLTLENKDCMGNNYCSNNNWVKIPTIKIYFFVKYIPRNIYIFQNL